MEFETIRYIATHTRIPVPRVWTYYSWRGRGYIVMSRVRGVKLRTVLRTSTVEFQEAVVQQLADCIQQLRSLPTPYGSRICSVLGGRVRDFRMGYDPTGPFKDEENATGRLARLVPEGDTEADSSSPPRILEVNFVTTR